MKIFSRKYWAQELKWLPPIKDIKLNEYFDVIITIAGFEDRGFSFSEYCALKQRKDGKVGKSAVIITYEDSLSDKLNEANKSNINVMKKALQVSIDDRAPTILSYDFRDDKVDAWVELTKVFGKKKGWWKDKKVCLDISVTSSRMEIELLLGLLSSQCQLTLIYSESCVYHPIYSEYLEYSEKLRLTETEFLTQGVSNIFHNQRVLGRISDGDPLELILFPAFDEARSSAIIRDLSPAKVTWIYSRPHLRKDSWRLEAQKNLHSSMFSNSSASMTISTFDYRKTIAALSEIHYLRGSSFLHEICCLGSKLQKVGVSLFLWKNPDVAASFVLPKTWNSNRFSHGFRRIWELNFGSTIELGRRLDRAWQPKNNFKLKYKNE